MPTNTETVSNRYSSIADLENRRLIDHPMERELTLRAIRKGLASISNPGGPETTHIVTPKRIADIGGGPGKLAFALADEGHDVDLVDLSPGLIQLAQEEQDRRRQVLLSTVTSSSDNENEKKPGLLRSISVGNALTLDTHPLFTDGEGEGAYDAVLLLGPLYHLLEESERATAVAQALRLVKPNRQGVLFVAFVSIAAHLRDLAVRDPGRLLERWGFYEGYLSSGRYEKIGPDGLTAQSYHTPGPDAIRAFFAQHFPDELELVELRSTEGILGGGLDATLAKLGEEGGADGDNVVQAWADLLFERFSTGEEYLGCADHLLATLRRK